ncbi:MAG: class I SAM-dependent methyltransferase [Myxococcota bacterium]
MARSYKWVLGSWITDEMYAACARLYSEHYGFWAASPNDGWKRRRVRQTPEMIRRLTASADSRLAMAYENDVLIGYAVAIQTRADGYGIVSWVTQLVVHERFRDQDVAKRLLFSIWKFSTHKAWGLVTANPYAVRALEKATRRRCRPSRIARARDRLFNVGLAHVPYLHKDHPPEVDATQCVINTQFFVDHSELPAMLAEVTTSGVPWLLGELKEGHEWFAFTFDDQQPLTLAADEIEKMLQTSDEVVREAYSRMDLNSAHKWMRHAHKEADDIVDFCGLTQSSSVLDLGCGIGRHAIELAKRGHQVVGVEFIGKFTELAQSEAARQGVQAEFVAADGRSVDLGRTFDCVVCLYDVIGSFADQEQNRRIAENIARHLRPGGTGLISVMNMGLTLQRAKRNFSLKTNPQALQELPASNIMESTGDVFNPDFYMIDTDFGVVYRKEQFQLGGSLPEEFIVRDRRYYPDEITKIAEDAGLAVDWVRSVSAGRWSVENPLGKELLLRVHRPE